MHAREKKRRQKKAMQETLFLHRHEKTRLGYF